LIGAMAEVKASFDPHNLFNPGKIIPDGRFEIDDNLRLRPGHELKLPFTPSLAFAAKDGSFVRNLEQCNGCGGCRKESPTMCPTFLATGEEIMSTRGRANAIRAALELRGLDQADPLRSRELEMALSNCLSCKACTIECPSNVNMALLKAELLHARILRDGLSWQQRLFGSVDWLAKLGCRLPTLANMGLNSPVIRSLLAKCFGITERRPLPRFARQTFGQWFARHNKERRSASRGRVVLWDDTFVRYYEPHIGMAAVKVLEAAGFEVELPLGRKCCGRPAFSQGHLSRARRLGRHNLQLLNLAVDHPPIILLEPSCYSMFIEDYRELSLPGADRVARRCVLFEQFIEDLLSHEPNALQFKVKSGKVLIHAHCHVKALTNPAFLGQLAKRLPQREVTLLDTGCCGMAGAFGALQEKYELSLKVAEPLTRELSALPAGVTVVASGTSCRQQIGHVAEVRPRHMAELLAEALV